MSKEEKRFMFYEDDTHIDLDKYLKMSPEELDRNIEELYQEMKANPQKKEPVKSKVKCILDIKD